MTNSVTFRVVIERPEGRLSPHLLAVTSLSEGPVNRFFLPDLFGPSEDEGVIQVHVEEGLPSVFRRLLRLIPVAVPKRGESLPLEIVIRESEGCVNVRITRLDEPASIPTEASLSAQWAQLVPIEAEAEAA